MVPPQGSPRPIRVGIMCNGRRFPAWQAKAIRSLTAVPGVEISLLVVRAAPEKRPSKWHRLKDRQRLLWILFNKGYVERRSRASRSVDMTAELDHVPEIACSTIAVGSYAERFSDADVAAIRSSNLDLLLRFSFGIVKGAILDAARFGIWSFHHGDERAYRGRPPGFWELYEGQQTVGSVLQRLTERLDGGIVLHRGFFRVTPYSYVRTRDEALLGSSEWPSIVVRQIQSGDASSVSAEPSSTQAPVRRDPVNATTIAFLMRLAARFLIAQLRGTTMAAKWSVGIADVPIGAFLTGPMPQIRWIGERGRSRYLADPFALEYRGTTTALVEDYDYATHRGVISAVDLDGDNDPAVVLDTGVHASYPFLFEADGNVYCIPETYQADQVRLYTAIEFPHRWEQVATILEGIAGLDSTVFRHEGRWWLMCTDQANGPNTKLHVFHAQSLEGPWEPHALNPVKTDVRCSRPAGTPFVHEDELYRPTQDNSTSYGGAITITRIDVLTPHAFSETIVRHIPPPTTGPYRDGIHTLSAVGRRTVVDGRRDTFIWDATRRELAGRISRILRVFTKKVR